MLQSAGLIVRTMVGVQKKMMCTNVGVKKIFMVKFVNTKMSVTLIPVSMATAPIILIITVVAVLQGTQVSTVRPK